MSTQIEPIVQNRSVKGMNEVVWICKEYEKSTLNLGDLKILVGIKDITKKSINFVKFIPIVFKHLLVLSLVLLHLMAN